MKMKKVKLVLLILSLCCLCACGVSGACNSNNETYIPHYETEDCSVSENEINNSSNTVNYNKKFAVGKTTLYFDSDLKEGQTVDKWIECVSKFNNILKQKEFVCVNAVYLIDKLIANYKSDNGVISMSFKPETAEEEAFAWILQAVSGNDNLPYGVFAGLAADWLEIEEYSSFVHSSLDGAKYLTELQFPIYEKGNLPDGERAYAWSFSKYLVDSLIQSGKTEKQIIQMDSDELISFLNGKFGIISPDYTFYPNSTKYEYKVKQGCFTYYINREFNDLILPKSRFNTSYNFISDWLKDNSSTAKESNSVFGIGSMYDIDVYLDDGLKSNGISGEAYSNASTNYIKIYSVGSFSHEYIHHILYKNGKSGNLREVFTEFHANTSKYSNLMWYYLLSGKCETYPYSDEIREKQTYLETIKLYNKISAFEASPDNFNYWLYADCFSLLYTNKGEKWISRLQHNSCMYYIDRMYGSDSLWLLNSVVTLPIDGKSYETIVYEWMDYLKTLKN